MRPAQGEFNALNATPAAIEPPLAELVPQHPRQMGQVVRLVARTGKGKIRVQGTTGRQEFWAVFPWFLRERQDRRRRIPTAVLRALPWQGAGPDPGMPAGWDETEGPPELIP